MKNSYPPGFHDRSKKKHSARKSVRINEANNSDNEAKVSPAKKESSARKAAMESNNKSGKRSALKKKSEKIDQANQTQSSRKKITGTKTMNNTIKEGHNFIDGKPAHYVDKEDEKDEEGKLRKSISMNQTIEEANKFLARGKSSEKRIDNTGSGKKEEKASSKKNESKSKSKEKSREKSKEKSREKSS